MQLTANTEPYMDKAWIIPVLWILKRNAMALQHKSVSWTAENRISCTDDSITKQNEYQEK